jgi:hypothetical protein
MRTFFMIALQLVEAAFLALFWLLILGAVFLVQHWRALALVVGGALVYGTFIWWLFGAGR